MGKYIVKISAIAKKHLADIHKSGNESVVTVTVISTIGHYDDK